MARKHHSMVPMKCRARTRLPVAVTFCWLCDRPCDRTIVWHHPAPKSRGGRDIVPMHPLRQQTLIAKFTNSELQRHGPPRYGASVSLGSTRSDRAEAGGAEKHGRCVASAIEAVPR